MKHISAFSEEMHYRPVVEKCNAYKNSVIFLIK